MAEEQTVSIKGLRKEDVFIALYNGARGWRYGFRDYAFKPLSRSKARQLLREGKGWVEMLAGRRLRVQLAGEKADAKSYNSYNGEEAAEKIIAELRATRRPDSTYILEMGENGTLEAAMDAIKEIKEGRPQVIIIADGASPSEIYWGLGDVRGLEEKISEVSARIREKQRKRYPEMQQGLRL